MMTMQDRCARLVELAERVEARGDSDALIEREPDRYALVEQSNRGEQPWLSTHETPQEAIRYSFGQEYAEDWAWDEIVDLDTGEVVPGRVEIRWVPIVGMAPGVEADLRQYAAETLEQDR